MLRSATLPPLQGARPAATAPAAGQRQGYVALVEEWNRERIPEAGARLPEKFKLLDEIQRCGSLPAGWDSYSAEPPSPLALAKAVQALEVLYNLGTIPVRAVPLADGGVALLLMARPFYAAIEIYNDGEAIAAFSDRRDRQCVWDVSIEEPQLTATIGRLRELMHG